MNERVWDITIYCDQCGANLTQLTDVSGLPENGSEPDWRHDQYAPWGHGSMGGGTLAEWYDKPTNDMRLRTRTHTDEAGVLHLLCQKCRNSAEFSADTWRTIARLLASASQSRASISDFRSIAQATASASATRRRRRRQE